jgi:hypothetical protein
VKHSLSHPILLCKHVKTSTLAYHFTEFSYQEFLTGRLLFPRLSLHLARTQKAGHHVQQPYIPNQQDWREWDYLTVVVAAEQQDARTAASSRAKAAPHILADAEPETLGCGGQQGKPWPQISAMLHNSIRSIGVSQAQMVTRYIHSSQL